MSNRARVLCISGFLALLGCSDATANAPASPNEAGAPHSVGGASAGGAANPPASGGSASGGASPNFAVSGSSGASGSAASAGASGGAMGGSAGTNGRGPAPTFTTLYDSIITPNCGGAQCHLKRPTPFGYDFSSKSAASSSWRADVIAGDAENSPMFQVLNLAIMPKDRPPLTIEQLFMIYDWINAGALDN